MAGPAKLKTAFGDAHQNDVAKVHIKHQELINETLEKSRKDGDENTLEGGLINTAITRNNKRERDKAKEEAFETLLLQLTVEQINNILDDVEKGITELERLLNELKVLEARLDKNEHGEVDWEKYAREHLSKEQMVRAGGDTAAIIAMLQDKLVDDFGHPLDDSDVALALSGRKQAEDKVAEVQEDLDQVDHAHNNGAGDAATKDRASTYQNQMDEIYSSELFEPAAPDNDPGFTDVFGDAASMTANLEEDFDFEREDGVPMKDDPFAAEPATDPFAGMKP